MGNLAAAQAKLREWSGVLETCARALRLSPSYTKALLLRGRALMNLWRVSEALESYRGAVKAQEEALDAARRACGRGSESGSVSCGKADDSMGDCDTAGHQRAGDGAGGGGWEGAGSGEEGEEEQKRRVIAAIMRDAALSPQQRQERIHRVRMGADVAGGGGEEGGGERGSRAGCREKREGGEGEEGPETLVAMEERELDTVRALACHA